MESPLVASCDRLVTSSVFERMLLMTEVSAMVGNDCGVNVSKERSYWRGEASKGTMERRLG